MKINEFHFISPIENIPSVLTHGILSHDEASKLEHSSVAMAEIQERRDKVKIPGGLMLHKYANVYFHARNPMLYKLQGQLQNICVLKISTEIRHIDGVVIADQNASSDYVRFLSIGQVSEIDLEAVYSRDWNDDHQPTYWRKKSQKCAEMLIPKYIESRYITGAYVLNDTVKEKLKECGFTLPITIDSDLFFQ